MLQVRRQLCETCIFRPGNVMRLKSGRVKQMVDDCTRNQGFIPCHETMVYTDEEGESAKGPVCRGFFDAHGHGSQLVRIAERLNAIEEVE